MNTKYRTQPKLGNNGAGTRVSTNVRKPLPMVEEVPRAQLPAPKQAPKRAPVSRLGNALKIGAKATVGVAAATYSKGLNTGEDAELARRRAMPATIDKPKAKKSAFRFPLLLSSLTKAYLASIGYTCTRRAKLDLLRQHWL